MTPTPSPSPTPTPEPYPFTKTIANVDDFVNVRKGPGTNTPIIGKLFKNGVAQVLGTEGDWTHISSGKLDGYVFSEYLHLGDDAVSYADKISGFNARVHVNSLNIRKGPGTEYDKIGSTTNGKSFPAILSLSNKEWVAIQYDPETIGYVFAEYVTLVSNLKEAMTLVEITEVKHIPVTYRDPISISDKDMEVFVLVVAAEAFWEPYDGKVAVANVIINRLLNDSTCDTIYEVVTKPGQFEGYQYIDRYRSKDLSDCRRACKEALSGKNNIGNFLFFHADYYVDATNEWPLFTAWHKIAGHVFFRGRTDW
jgi:uncharacterized protein YraI